jgi:hypothetical protein
MIRTGSSPFECTTVCPQPCNRQSPRQERSQGLAESVVLTGSFGTRIADGSPVREPSPEANLIARGLPLTLHSFSIRSGGHPTKTNRGGRSDEQARGPGRSEMIGHPSREQTCEGPLMKTP